MLDALSRSAFRNTAEYTDLIESTTRTTVLANWIPMSSARCIHRHCNDQGHLTHIFEPRLGDVKPTHDCNALQCAVEHRLGFLGFDVIWTSVSSEIPSNFVPILAGHLSNGQRAYVAADNAYTNPSFDFVTDRGDAAI